MAVRIGISGWQYKEFKDIFYPKGLKTVDWLKYYSSKFSAVELNASFYRFSTESHFLRWFDQTPAEFKMAVKANKYFTHFNRLADPQNLWPGFLQTACHLQQKLGPILFQTPETVHYDLEKLRHFLEHISGTHPLAFELRHASWHRQETYDLLSRHGAAFCVFDIRGFQSPIIATSKLVYVRLHGPLKEPYRGAYSPGSLKSWASLIRTWSAEGHEVYFFFDNTMWADAIANAQTLVEECWSKSNTRPTISP
jgi:uncharacterized protein YecE (DUF72 family)